MEYKYVLISFCNIPTTSTSPLLCAKIPYDAGKPITFAPVASGYPSPISTATGLTQWGHEIFVMFSSNGKFFISVLSQSDLSPVFFQELPEIKDGHSIFANESGLSIVSTGTDEVIRYDITSKNLTNPQVIWRASTTGVDTHHINSIIEKDGELFVSAFGPKESKLWASARQGYIHNITRDIRVKDKIYHPHSLSAENGQLYYCESHAGSFCTLEGPIFDLDGYTRGVSWLTSQIVCSGTSIGRRVSKSTGMIGNPGDPGEPLGECALTTRNITTGAVVSKVDLSWFGPEIYDVLTLESNEINLLQTAGRAQLTERQAIQSLIQNIGEYRAEHQATVREYQVKINELSDQKEQAVLQAAAKDQELLGIYRSRSWRLVQFIQKIRLLLIPYGSFRAEIAGRTLSEFRKMKVFFLEVYVKLTQGIKRNKIAKMLEDKRVDSALNKLAKKVDLIYRGPVLESPTVSIIIPVYNQVELTLNCLLSIASSQDLVNYEIIIIDDASTDKTKNLLKNIRGLRYFRNNTNKGFLISCNEAAKRATGEYLVFLNNDTRVHELWLANLLATFSLMPNTGLVGSKLIFPNGKLQEAGGVIWADGSAKNYGRGDDPHNYLYNYMCEVDYVSGASIMLPRTLWEGLGGFDLQYQPAYYEDVDLAFKIRSAGYKVVYQPFSQITHFEGGSNGIDLNSGIKHYQVINHEKFFNTWQKTIASYGSPAETPDYVQRNRYIKSRVLFIDDGTPKPDYYAGGLLSEFYIITLREAGYAVTFLPHIDLRYAESYTQTLQRKGVECVYKPYISSSKQYIKQNGYHFDYVVTSRANVALETIDLIKEFAPKAKIIFNTIDLHFLRLDRAAQLSKKNEDIETARQAREDELSIIRKVDCTLVVSEVEQHLLATLQPDKLVKVVPFPADIYESQKGFAERQDIVFLGGFMHKPNVDAVLFFVKEVWPLIARALPNARFVIAGAQVTKKIKQLETNNIIVRGYVNDLADLFATAKLSVAPLRFGAGIKGKVLTSLGYGVPCVATSIATEGTGLADGKNILVANTPQEFADTILRVYKSAELWESLSEQGRKWILQNYSRSVVAAKLLDAFKEI